MTFTRTITTKREYKPRYAIIGRWTGYRIAQEQEVHRVITRDKSFADKVRALGSILYTDGTRLVLRVEEIPYGAPKRMWPEMHGYDTLINDCIRLGVNSVQALSDAEKEKGDGL